MSKLSSSAKAFTRLTRGDSEQTRLHSDSSTTPVTSGAIVSLAGESSEGGIELDQLKSSSKEKLLRVVLLNHLEKLIDDADRQQASLHGVLDALAHTDKWLTPVSTAHFRVAIVSYRQMKGFGEYEEHTFDGHALRSILKAARALEGGAIQAVWVDVWCYRNPRSGEYDHSDFVNRLHDVTEGIAAVVWLPCSKGESFAQYQYRLFCTYEAARVKQRSLPVAIAGYGPTAFQRRVRRFGSLTPALWADGTIDQLCRFNLIFYVVEVVVAVSIVYVLAIGLPDGGVGDSKNKGASYPLLASSLFVEVFMPLVWLVFRATIGQQCRLACNARNVLRTMMAASRGGTGGAAVRVAPNEEEVRALQHNLAWLPSYDRRDVLTVYELLQRSLEASSDRASRLEAVHDLRALAFSAYCAALLDPSEGDDLYEITSKGRAVPGFDPTQRSRQHPNLRAWLDKKGMFDALLDSSRLSARGVAPAAHSCCAVALVDAAESGRATWMEDDSLEEMASLHSACIPLSSLKALGWVVAPGASCALIAPLGALAVPAPVGGKWSAHRISDPDKKVRRPRLDLIGPIFLSQILLSFLDLIITYALDDWNAISSQASAISGRLIGILVLPASTVICLIVFWNDVASIRWRRWPLPMVVFNERRFNLTVLLIFVALTIITTAAIVSYASDFAQVDAPSHNGTVSELTRVSERIEYAWISSVIWQFSFGIALFIYQSVLCVAFVRASFVHAPGSERIMESHVIG